MAGGAASRKLEGNVGETEVPQSGERQDITTGEEAETTGGVGEDGGSVRGAQWNMGYQQERQSGGQRRMEKSVARPAGHRPRVE